VVSSARNLVGVDKVHKSGGYVVCGVHIGGAGEWKGLFLGKIDFELD